MAKLLTGTRVYGTANVDNVLTVGNITPVNSTSNTTGSLIVIGGVGILGNTYTGNLVISGSAAAGNGITFADGTRQTTAASGSGVDQFARDTANSAATTDYTSLTAPAGVYGNSTFVPVITLSANGRVISVTNTAITVSGGGGGGGGLFNYYQNTAPSTANSHDLWTNSDTGVMYENFGTPSTPVWAEVGPTTIVANNLPGTIVATQANITYTPATTINTAMLVQAANTKGGTGYADVLQLTNLSGGATQANKFIRLTSIGELQVINSAYQIASMSLTDAGDLTLAGNTTINGISPNYAPNRPAFRISGNGGTISATTTVAGGYMVVDYNQGSYLNTSTGLFTAPVAGLYQVNVVVRTNSNTNPGINQIIIRKTAAIGGAVTTQIMVEFGTNTTMNHAGGSTVVKMAAGDTLKFDVTSGSISFDGNDSWSVAYLG